jgi:serine/threonine-protein kinase
MRHSFALPAAFQANARAAATFVSNGRNRFKRTVRNRIFTCLDLVRQALCSAMDNTAPDPKFSGISRYRIEKQIGSGGGGSVFKAWDEKLQRAVALKRIKTSALPDGHSAAQEALNLSGLQHPNIVTIHDFVEDADGPFVVLEYVEGEPLGDVIARGAFPLEEFSLLAQQSLDALAAAHAQGLVHRDLKPDNLMLKWLPDGSFQLKMLDFGLAKVVAVPQAATCQQDGTFIGSIHTMSPESLQKAPVDARSDLYSLGCVFYFALTQQMPFTGATISDVIVSHLQHQVVPLEKYRPDLPPVIAQWVQQFIELDPNQRFHGAKQALAIFAKLLQQQREPAPPLSSTSPRRAEVETPDEKPSRGLPWMAWAAGGCVLVALALLFGPKFGTPTVQETPATATPVARATTATPPPSATGLPDAKAIAALVAPPAGEAPASSPAAPAPAASPPSPPAAPAPATPSPSSATVMVAAETKSPPAAPAATVLHATDLDGARAHVGGEVVLEGTVANLSMNKTGDIRYLNFDRNFRNSVSLVFFTKMNPEEFSPEKLQPYVGKQIRVHGVIDQYKETLQIKVKKLSQIEVVP